jgi:hypothetical protein
MPLRYGLARKPKALITHIIPIARGTCTGMNCKIAVSVTDVVCRQHARLQNLQSDLRGLTGERAVKMAGRRG